MIRTLRQAVSRKSKALEKNTKYYSDGMTPYFESLLAILADNELQGFRVSKSIGVTSTNHGEGVSTIALSLAANASNLLVDDPITLVLATPASDEFSRRYGIEGKPGIADILHGTAQTSECMQEIFGGRIKCLSSGLESKSHWTLDPFRTASLIQKIAEDSRLMVVDLPPVTKGGVCLATAGRLSGVIFTVEANRVAAEEIAAAQTRLASVGVNVLGAVLNKKS